MKQLLFIFGLVMSIQLQAQTIYNFKVTDISGNTFDLSSLKGKKVMLVNTASKCGLTPQFEQLQQLYLQFKDSNFGANGQKVG
jgi:glutathione peroxidase